MSREEITVGCGQSLWKPNLGVPTEVAYAGYVQQLAGGSVGFGMIELQPTTETHGARYGLREFDDREVLARSNIDDRRMIQRQYLVATLGVQIGEKNQAVGRIVGEQELASRLSATPD